MAEGRKGLVLGVVDEEIAVGQVQDAGLAGRIALHVPLGFPELPANLEGNERFAGAGGHGQEYTFLTAHNSGEGAVHGDLLVIARNLAGFDVGGGQELPFLVRRGQAEVALEAVPEIFGGREACQGGFLAFEEVELDDALAVGGIGELEVEHPGVFLGLLQAGGGGFVQGLGLDDGQHGAGLVAEEIVRAFGGFPPDLGARDHDAAIGEGTLLENLLVGPAGVVQLGHDELPAGVGFGDHAGTTPDSAADMDG
jgi:hypothetical protein